MSGSEEQIRALLEHNHTWPADYVFKFIVLRDDVSKVKQLLPGATAETRPSKGGKYLAVTLRYHMASAQAVLDVYEAAKAIPGLLAL